MANVPISTKKLNEVFDSDPRNDSEIASSFNVSKQSISAWRNGSRSPVLSKLKEIAEYYQKDVMWFFGMDDDEKDDLPIPTEDDEQIGEIVNLLRSLSARKKADALRYIRYLSISGEDE